jgi:hypothetical protein
MKNYNIPVLHSIIIRMERIKNQDIPNILNDEKEELTENNREILENQIIKIDEIINNLDALIESAQKLEYTSRQL